MSFVCTTLCHMDARAKRHTYARAHNRTRWKGGGDPKGSAKYLAPRPLVREVRREPALYVIDRLPFATRVARDLILAEPPDGEVPRLRMREVESADARRRRHRRVLGERHAHVMCAEQREQLERL